MSQSGKTTVAEKLGTEVFCRCGVPVGNHSDQGRNFEFQVFHEICRIMEINKTKTTQYHPQSGGMMERFNEKLGRRLAKIVDSHKRNCVRYIPLNHLPYKTLIQKAQLLL